MFHKISVGGGGAGAGVGVGGGGGYYREDMRMGSSYHGNTRPQPRMDSETLSMHTLRQHSLPINPWAVDASDAGSLVSDRDAAFGRQYSQGTVNGYSSQKRQGGGTMTYMPTMQRSLSGTLQRVGGMTGGEAEIVHQQSFKGPAHRTISRITNRNRLSMGSMSGSNYARGGDVVDRGFVSGVASASQGSLMMQRPGTLSRAMSTKSIQSVGRGMDIFNGQMEMGASMGNLSGWATPTFCVSIWNRRCISCSHTVIARPCVCNGRLNISVSAKGPHSTG